jgi:hypothetical protein
MGTLKKSVGPMRLHIDLSQGKKVSYWTRHLHVSSPEPQNGINEVGNSASAVRKQLVLSRQDQVAASE